MKKPPSDSEAPVPGKHRAPAGQGAVPAAVLCSLAAVAACAALGLTIGSAGLPLSHVAGILGRALGLPLEPAWKPWEATVVLDIRLPRIIVGLLVGGGLAISGTVLQGLFRNPLASPGVLGISAGASLGAVLAIFLGVAALHVGLLPLAAFAGAAASAFAVYRIGTRRGRASTRTLLLAGIAIGALNGALTSFVISMALANWEIGKQMIFWQLGGLDGRTWEHVYLAAPPIVLGSALLLSRGRDLDALLLGEVHAASLGVDVHRTRALLILVTALVTGAAVAVSGLVAFVGLVVPHVLRLVAGPHHRRLLPLSLPAGAVFLVCADLLARSLIAPEELRLGVITACVGAPFFLYLLVRKEGEAIPA